MMVLKFLFTDLEHFKFLLTAALIRQSEKLLTLVSVILILLSLILMNRKWGRLFVKAVSQEKKFF